MGIKSAVLASAMVALFSMASSGASAITYDLTLNNLSGQTVGSGMFTISGSVRWQRREQFFGRSWPQLVELLDWRIQLFPGQRAVFQPVRHI